RQIRPIWNVLAVAIHDLAEQRDLLYALAGQAAHFRHDLANGATALHAAPEGDDAKAARVRAAVHNRYVSGDQVAAVMRGKDERLLVVDGVPRGAIRVINVTVFVFEAALPQEIDHRRGF